MHCLNWLRAGFVAFVLGITIAGSAVTGFAQKPTLFVEERLSYASCISITSQGRYVATGDLDGVKLYDLALGRQVRILRHFAVDAVAFSPDGQVLVSAGQSDSPAHYSGLTEYSLKIWRVSDGALLHTVTHQSAATNSSTRFHALAFTPSGTVVAAAAEDNTVVLVDMSSGSEQRSFRAKTGLLSIAFSRDGTLLAGGGYRGFAGVWRTDTGDLVRELKHQDQNVTAVRFSYDGDRIATGSADKRIRLWNAKVDNPAFVADTGDQIYDVAFDPRHNALLVTGGLKLSRWDLDASHPSAETLATFTSQAHGIAIDGSGMLAVIAAETELTAWDLATNKVTANLGGLAQMISCLSLDREDKALVADMPVGAQVWKMSSGVLMGTLDHNYRCSEMGGKALLSPTGDLVAYAGFPSVEIRSAKTNLPVQQLPFEVQDSVHVLAFRPDGNELATGSMQGTIGIWDLSTGKRAVAINTNPPVRSMQVPGTSGMTVQDPATMWPSVVSNLAWRPDGKLLAGIAVSVAQGQILHLWSVEEGRELPSFELGTDYIGALAFSPDGATLLTGDDRGKITLWDMKSRKKLKVLSSDTNRITALLFSSTPGVLFSGSAEGMIRVWDMRTYTRVLTMVATGPGDWLVVNDDGLFDGTPDAMKAVGWRLENSNDVASLEAFYNDYFYPGLMGQTLAGGRPKAQLDIAATLQLPGLRTMLAERLVTVRRDKMGEELCFPERPAQVPPVYRDAFPLAFDPAKILGNPTDPTCRFEYPLEGTAQYEVVNAVQVVKAPVAKSSYSGRLLDVSQSRLHVQTIAISDYTKTFNGLAALPYSVKEAEAIRKFFADQSKDGSSPFLGVKVWDGLYDDSATRAGILQRLHEIAQTAEPNDVVVLMLVGHGIVPAGQEMYYFIAKDTVGPDPQQQHDTGLSTSMLVQALREMKTRRFIVIIDSCQSGGALEALAKIIDLRPAATGSNSNNTAPNDGGIYIFAAASPLQQAVQPNDVGSLATELLSALGSAANDRKSVTATKLMTIVAEQAKRKQKTVAGEPTPLLLGVGGDFLITGTGQ